MVLKNISTDKIITRMKKIALNDTHEALGAKMVSFAGFNMPIQYEGVSAEHVHVREKLGVFDVSHMGEFMVRGSQAEEFLQYVTSNDVAKLYDGRVQYSCLPNDKGGIVDDLLVYRFSEGQYMLVVNASNIEKDWQWLQKHAGSFDVQMTDESDSYSLFAVQGPKATAAMQSLTAIDLAVMKYYTFETGTFAGVENVIVSATGYTGAGGLEIYVKNRDAKAVWDKVMEAGRSYDIKPIGLGARDTLRTEMGFCLYGNDIDDNTSPIEAGLGWITKFTKDFINSDSLKRQKEEGVTQKLVGLILKDRGIPRKDYPIVNAEGEQIGRVTSGTQSPLTRESIGLGYVNTEYARPGTEIFIEVRNKKLSAEVKRPPFIES